MKLVAFSAFMLACASTFGAGAHEYQAQLKDYTYVNRVDNFRQRPTQTGAVVMLGDSLTDLGGWPEFFSRTKIINRGISGDTTFGVLSRLDEIQRHRPRKVFLTIGTNDVFYGEEPTRIIARYRQIVQRLKAMGARVYVGGILPTNHADFPKTDMRGLDNRVISELNEAIAKLAKNEMVSYVPVQGKIYDQRGNFAKGLTYDGIHPNGEGYKVWATGIAGYVKQ